MSRFLRRRVFYVILVALLPVANLFPFSVTDALGRRVHFAGGAERVVLAGRGVLMVADSLCVFPEAVPRLTAVERISQGKGNFLAAIYPGLHDKFTLPPEVGAEEVAALRPDLVIMKSAMESKLGRVLEKLGIRVVYLDFETPEVFERDILTLGQIFQNESRAAEVVSFYRERLSVVDGAVSGLPVSSKPRALLLYYSERDAGGAFNVPPDSWMQTTMVERAGGVPVWKGSGAGKGWTKVSFEQIAAWDPDQIYVTVYFGDAKAVVEKLSIDRAWGRLTAVRGKRLFAFPCDFYSWDQPDPRWILGLLWLASKLHPERFPALDIRREAEVFFKELYSVSDETFRGVIEPVFDGDMY